MDKIRHEFEAWARETDRPVDLMPNDFIITALWEGWQASRAALTVKLPANCCGHAITVDELRSMLEKSGIALEVGK